MTLYFDYRTYAAVRRGCRRKRILSLLHKADTGMTSKDVSSVLKLQIHKTSATLRFFKDFGLAKVLNPDAPFNRKYIITKKGRQIASRLDL